MFVVLTTLALGAELAFGAALARAPSTPAAVGVEAAARAGRASAAEAAAWAGNPELVGELRSDETTVAVRVPVDLAGPARLAAAPAAAEAARAHAAIARAAVHVAVGAAWLDARRDVEVAALWEGVAAQAGALAAGARARAAAGEWSPADAALVQADAARLLGAALDAGRGARHGLRGLCVLVDLPLEPLPTLGPWPTLAAPPAPDPTRLPQVIAADLDARAALAEARAAAFARLPAIEFEAGWMRHGDTPGSVVGFGLELPLFAPRAAAARGAAARADEAQALRRRAAAEGEGLVREVAESLADAERVWAAWAEVDLAAALEAPATRLAAGEVSVADYLEQRDRVVAHATAAVEARWRLERARLAGWELAGQAPVEAS